MAVVDALLSGWAGFLTLAFHKDTLVVLAAAGGFTAVRVANHRSRRTAFRISVKDPFQWGEMVFFFLLLLKGLWG